MVKSLKFEEEPNYKKLRKLMNDILMKELDSIDDDDETKDLLDW